MPQDYLFLVCVQSDGVWILWTGRCLLVVVVEAVVLLFIVDYAGHIKGDLLLLLDVGKCERPNQTLDRLQLNVVDHQVDEYVHEAASDVL